MLEFSVGQLVFTLSMVFLCGVNIGFSLYFTPIKRSLVVKEVVRVLNKDYFERALIRAAHDGYGMDNREEVIELSSFLADDVKKGLVQTDDR